MVGVSSDSASLLSFVQRMIRRPYIMEPVFVFIPEFFDVDVVQLPFQRNHDAPAHDGAVGGADH